MAEYRIECARVDGIAALYDELDRVFMTGESWRLGASLDALDDLLYGGYGALAGDDAPRVVWVDHEVSRAALGRAATEAWLREKLTRPQTYRSDTIARDLDEVAAGRGATYFERVMQVFGDHPAISLTLA